MKKINVNYILMISLIIGLSISVGILNGSEKETMTEEKYIWKYTVLLTKTTSAGTLKLEIETSNQQVIEDVFLIVRSTVGEDDGGTSKTSIFYLLDSTSTDRDLVIPTTATEIFLPNDEDIDTFGCLDIRDFRWMDGDRLVIQRTYKPVGGKIVVELRGTIDKYALPNITITGGTITPYNNEIVGVIR